MINSSETDISIARNTFLSGEDFQEDCVRPEVLESWKRSKNRNVDPFMSVLPKPISKSDALGRLTAYNKFLRDTHYDFYGQSHMLLAEINSAMCSLIDSVIVTIRGNEELISELRSLNFDLGTNLSEDLIGTTAVALSLSCGNPAWCKGAEHYSSPLLRYVAYAGLYNDVDGKRNPIVFICRESDFTNIHKHCFEMLMSSYLQIGNNNDPISRLREELLSRGLDQSDRIILLVNNKWNIVYVSPAVTKVFNKQPLALYGRKLQDVFPELSSIIDSVAGSKNFFSKKVTISIPQNNKDLFFLNTEIIKNGEIILGFMVELYTPEMLKATARKVVSLKAYYTFDSLIGTNPAFVNLKNLAQRMAHSNATVLIHGESGTGKELFAQAIHNASTRRYKPFISINCAAIPKDLIGSELFGYVKGAFTGAKSEGARGKFELADQGTLFLDEIGEMPNDMQAVLLKVLEDKRVTRIGGSYPIPVDVKIIVATNRNLSALVQSGQFRQDLYYRLNVLSLRTIPLREHKEDIPILINYFLNSLFQSNNASEKTIASPDFIRSLQKYDWPGNVRELKNVVERCYTLRMSNVLTLDDLPMELKVLSDQHDSIPNNSKGLLSPTIDDFFEKHDDYEKLYITKLLEKYDGNKTKVAKTLGISRTALYNKMKLYELM